MKILNLGCGAKISNDFDVVNLDWSFLLRVKSNTLLRLLAPILLQGDRRSRYERLGDNIVAHDLAKGIPFADGSVDVVYHSHMLEHLDRCLVPGFLEEVRRVLKPGGVHRIVVPDLELLCKSYLESLASSRADKLRAHRHDEFVAAIIEQCVRKEPAGSAIQKPFRRYLENRIFGDARKRGETHQWMYDSINLAELLTASGFVNFQQFDCRSSGIPDWERYGLDWTTRVGEFSPGSLYVESRKPDLVA